MMLQEEYGYFKKEMLKENKEGKFWVMANRELAVEYLEEGRKEFPELVMYEMGIEQYFCLNDKAKRKFIKLVERRIDRKQSELAELLKLKQEISF